MRRRYRGFSLPELLVALSVAAVMVSFAVPSYRELAAGSRMSSATNLLVAHLNAARTEAVTRGVPVAVCVSVDHAACSGTTNWETGWIAFTDAEGEPGKLDGADALLAVGQPPGRDLSLKSDQSYVRYDALGGLARQ